MERCVTNISSGRRSPIVGQSVVLQCIPCRRFIRNVSNNSRVSE